MIFFLEGESGVTLLPAPAATLGATFLSSSRGWVRLHQLQPLSWLCFSQVLCSKLPAPRSWSSPCSQSSPFSFSISFRAGDQVHMRLQSPEKQGSHQQCLWRLLGQRDQQCPVDAEHPRLPLSAGGFLWSMAPGHLVGLISIFWHGSLLALHLVFKRACCWHEELPDPIAWQEMI